MACLRGSAERARLLEIAAEVAETGGHRFVLLDGEAGAFSAALSPRLKLGSGSGEELEDHACRLAKAPHV